eukprot:scaffold89889_cov57-Phaeocystis_antarctica.AAC.2
MHAPCTRHPTHTPQVRPRPMVLVARLYGAAAAALLRLRAADRLLRPHASALDLRAHPRVPPPREPLTAHPGPAAVPLGSQGRAPDLSRRKRPGGPLRRGAILTMAMLTMNLTFRCGPGSP